MHFFLIIMMTFILSEAHGATALEMERDFCNPQLTDMGFNIRCFTVQKIQSIALTCFEDATFQGTDFNWVLLKISNYLQHKGASMPDVDLTLFAQADSVSVESYISFFGAKSLTRGVDFRMLKENNKIMNIALYEAEKMDRVQCAVDYYQVPTNEREAREQNQLDVLKTMQRMFGVVAQDQEEQKEEACWLDRQSRWDERIKEEKEFLEKLGDLEGRLSDSTSDSEHSQDEVHSDDDNGPEGVARVHCCPVQ